SKIKNSASGPNTAVSATPVLARYFSARWAMPRGSRMYGSRVPVSAMVHVKDNVGTAINGSMKAVAGSGIASMSEASMLFQPRMLEPSKPRPSVNDSSLNSPIGTLQCCQVPNVSTNLTSAIFAPLFAAISNTLLGVLMGGLSQVLVSVRDPAPAATLSQARAMSTKSKLAGSMVALFPVLVQVEAGHFNFLGRTQADNGFDDEGDDCRAHGGKDQGDQNGFDLLPNQRLESGVLYKRLQVICGQTTVDAGPGQHTGHKRAQGPTNGMDAESVQRVVVTKPRF